jgi:hypothetical protein
MPPPIQQRHPSNSPNGAFQTAAAVVAGDFSVNKIRVYKLPREIRTLDQDFYTYRFGTELSPKGGTLVATYVRVMTPKPDWKKQ